MTPPAAAILTPLVLDDDAPGRTEYRVHEPYRFSLSGVVFEVPAGMLTDLASIPRVLWRVVGHPAQRPLVRAAVPHDAMYRGRLLDGQGRPACFDRAAADRALYDLARAAGVGRVKAAIVYRAVRLCGRWSYAGQPPARDDDETETQT